MEMKMYSVRDRKSGLSEAPFMSFNDNTAVRDFKTVCQNPRFFDIIEDWDLYCIGTFETTTGIITNTCNDFIMSGYVDLTAVKRKEEIQNCEVEETNG